MLKWATLRFTLISCQATQCGSGSRLSLLGCTQRDLEVQIRGSYDEQNRGDSSWRHFQVALQIDVADKWGACVLWLQVIWHACAIRPGGQVRKFMIGFHDQFLCIANYPTNHKLPDPPTRAFQNNKGAPRPNNPFAV